MATLRWVAFCQKAVMDQDGELSLFGVVEVLALPQVPVIDPRPKYIVTIWKRDTPIADGPESVKYRSVFKSPSGTIVVPQNVNEAQMDRQRLRTLDSIQNIPFAEQGEYELIVQVPDNAGWRDVGTFAFYVATMNLAPPPA